MFNKEFLKKLTILLIEDDPATLKQLEKSLSRLFLNVITASNGLEGFNLYQHDKVLDARIDLILSDINMPIMNGIEMLEKIRTHDLDIPIIFTTARTDTQYLLKAISLGVDYYAIKPINIEDILQKIEKVCEKKYYEKLIHEKTLELEEYIKIINSVSTICKMNENGDITFANKLFLESLGLDKNDNILGRNIKELISLDIDKNIITELFETIISNKVWNDDLKYATKNSETIFIKSTVFKISNESYNEYINIGFVSTEDMNKKRDFHKKIIDNIKEKNMTINQSLDDVKKYEIVIDTLQTELNNIKHKHIKIVNQIEYYENELLNVDQKILKRLKIKNNEIEEYKKIIYKLKYEKENKFLNNEKLSNELMCSKNEVEKLYETLKRKEKRINELIEVVDLREHQLKKLDKTFTP